MSAASIPFRELLRKRRMTRHYLPDEIPRETVERIVSVVRRAPSGGGVYGVLPERVPRVKELLAVPGDVHFVCVLTIGKPAPDPRESEQVSRLSQRRRSLDELVRWERWG